MIQSFLQMTGGDMHIQCDKCDSVTFNIIMRHGFLFSVCVHCGDEVNLRQLQNTLDMVE